jgi:hypothetical protein
LLALAVPVYCGLSVLALLLQPLGLTFVELRLFPGPVLRTAGLAAAAVVTLVLLLWLLGRPEISDARIEDGMRPISFRWPLMVGLCGPMLWAFGLFLFLHSAPGKRAEAVAAQNLGPAYKYWTSSMTVIRGPLGRTISAAVVAYNDNDFYVIPVQWSEAGPGGSAQTQTSSAVELPVTGPETWTINGTSYQIEGTAAINLNNGEVMSVVKARCAFAPGIGEEPLARLLAKYAVGHGYTVQESRLNGKTQPVASSLGVALIYHPTESSNDVRDYSYRYHFDIAQLRAEVGPDGERNGVR